MSTYITSYKKYLIFQTRNYYHISIFYCIYRWLNPHCFYLFNNLTQNLSFFSSHFFIYKTWRSFFQYILICIFITTFESITLHGWIKEYHENVIHLLMCYVNLTKHCINQFNKISCFWYHSSCFKLNHQRYSHDICNIYVAMLISFLILFLLFSRKLIMIL